MQEGVTDVPGIEIPSTSPVFLAIVGVHVVFGIAAVAFGGRHFLKEATRATFAVRDVLLLAVVWTVASAAVLTAMRFEENRDVMALGLPCLAAVLLGRRALQQRWRGWVPLHITLMGSSYILLLTAFYVENGEDLPLWIACPQSPIGWFGSDWHSHHSAALRFHPMAKRPPP